MKRFSYKPPIKALFLTAALFLYGCSHLPQEVIQTPIGSYPPETRGLVSLLKQRNVKPATFKGTGKIRLWDKKRCHVARVAWISQPPKRLRMEILGISGRPATSLSIDGEWLYFYSHIDRRFYKKRSTLTLNNMISIPIQASDMIALLSGRVPSATHHPGLSKKDLGSNGDILTLKKRGEGVVEKIYFDKKKQHIQMVERFGSSGDLGYRAKFDRFTKINDQLIPFKLVISTLEGVVFELDIEKYWVDVPVSSAKFVLAPPGQTSDEPTR